MTFKKNTLLFVVFLGLKNSVNGGDKFFVSQVSQSQDWCIEAPNHLSSYSNPSYDESKLGFGICEKYLDEYARGDQAFTFQSNGKIRSLEYEQLCMIVNDGDNIGGGLVRLDDCGINSKLNKFTYDSRSKKIRLARPNDDYCLTNEGVTPEDTDTIHAKRCGSGDRYKWDLKDGRRYWEIIAIDCNKVMMPRGGATPKSGDRVYLDGGGSPENSWRFEKRSTGAELFRYKLVDGLCMQADRYEDGAAVRFRPCNPGTRRQRFIRHSPDGDFLHRITIEDHEDLCIVNHGATCEQGDEIIVKECDNVAGGSPVRWYEDES